MNTVGSVKVDISVVIGRTQMPIYQLLRMGRGAVIELQTDENEEVLVLANNVPVAKGEVIVNGDRIAVSITEVLRGGTGGQHEMMSNARAA